MTKRSATTNYAVVVNAGLDGTLRFDAGVFESRREAKKHVHTLGAIINVEGNNYPIHSVEIVSQTTTFRTLTTFTPQQTTVFVANELDSDLTAIDA